MQTLPQAKDSSEQYVPPIFEFLDECTEAFGWLIIAVSIGVVLLTALYSVAPPPLHVPGALLS
ncbi:hypothetical protein [Methylocapsa acidiphila]|uniref:hypothetical protein n=1 Tax=Methylocapsa acidiphila TaxID=133552 RepID=UPI000402203C|nr:hypothetical protein [Methylocapsa acidiphila]